MAKQKSSGWLDKFISKVPETFGKGVAASDVVQSKPGPVFLGNPYAKEMAKRQTYISPYDAEQKASPAMQQVFAEKADTQAKKKRIRNFLEEQQDVLGKAEMLSLIPTPFTEAVGGAAGITNAAISAALAGQDFSEGNYAGALGNFGAGALGVGTGSIGIRGGLSNVFDDLLPTKGPKNFMSGKSMSNTPGTLGAFKPLDPHQYIGQHAIGDLDYVSDRELKEAYQEALDKFNLSKYKPGDVGADQDIDKALALDMRMKFADRLPKFTENKYTAAVHAEDPLFYDGRGVYSERFFKQQGYDLSKLNPQDKALMDAYQHGYDRYFNKRPTLNTIPTNLKNYFGELSDQFNTAVQKNKINKDITLNRSVSDYVLDYWDPVANKSLGRGLRSELQVGDVYKDTGFMSTSLPNYDYGIGRFKDKIIVPGGGVQSYAFPNATSYGQFMGEQEVILPKGLIRRVEDVPEPGNVITSILNPYKNGGHLDKLQRGGTVAAESTGNVKSAPASLLTDEQKRRLARREQAKRSHDAKEAAKELAKKQTYVSADNMPADVRERLRAERETNARINEYVTNAPLTQSLTAMSRAGNDELGKLAAQTITEANPLFSAARLVSSAKDPVNNPYGIGKDVGLAQNALGVLGLVGDATDIGNMMYTPAVQQSLQQIGKGIREVGTSVGSNMMDVSRGMFSRSNQLAPPPSEIIIPQPDLIRQPWNVHRNNPISAKADRLRGTFWNSGDNNYLTSDRMRWLENNGGYSFRDVYDYNTGFSEMPSGLVEYLRGIQRDQVRQLTPREMMLLTEQGWGDAIPPRVSTPSIMDRLRSGVQSIFNRPNPQLLELEAARQDRIRTDYKSLQSRDVQLQSDVNRMLAERAETNERNELARLLERREQEANAYNPPRGGLDLSHFNINSRSPLSTPASLSSVPYLRNRSGLAISEILSKDDVVNKDVISKMAPEEFESTVFKPSGEVAPYKYEYDPLPGVYGMSSSEYVKKFNENLDLLNAIIAKRNKSGVDYRVTGLDESGALKFYTPEQVKRWQDDSFNVKTIEGLEQLKNDPVELQKRLQANNQTLADLDRIINSFKKDRIIAPEGTSTWVTRIIPGEFKGEIQDIANAEYYKSIPGLNMTGTTSGVFSDSVPRRGTGAYEAINEYLKSLDLGRVKPGFNSQSSSSRPLWENAVKKGKAFGYYNNPSTIYGAMKTVAPVIGAGAVASEFMDQKKNGGWLEKYNDGGPVQENYNDYSVSAPEGFQGDGYSNVGRNYSPAWGGQFKNGGDLSFVSNPKLRNMLEGYKPGFLETANDYRLPEGYMAGSIYPSTEVSTSIGGENGEPAYLIPSFKYGQPLQDPVQEFNMTGQYLGGPFKTWQDAEKFQEIRHQYVEKGQPLPSPIATSNMAMGGSLPGSVGFTYARTIDPAPSNGPYAKKTMASAQNGITVPGEYELMQEPDDQINYDSENPAFDAASMLIGQGLINSIPEANSPAIDVNIDQRNLKAEHTFSHIPGFSVFTGEPTESYMLKRTVSPYTTDEDVRLNTQMPNRPQDVNFISNYAGARPDPSSEYPTSVPYQGEKHWNIDRFIIDPEFSASYADLENRDVNTDKTQQRRNTLADMYKYFMLQNKGDKDTAWKQANEFMTKEIDPRISGPMYNVLRNDETLTPIKGPSLTDIVDINYLRDYNDLANEINLPEQKRSDKGREFIKNPASAKQAKDLAMDWLVNYKKMTPKQAESYYKKLPKNDKEYIKYINSKTKKDKPLYVPTDSNLYPDGGFQNGGEMRYYQEGLDFKPKTISRNGSVIKDDMGQWAHPGEITEIGSNQITMQGVPYPVLGISDTGDMQMMYPNQEYQYDGSSVTEYPMMKQGGQLTKLDQLTNFTNYNTKQPGGWLSKYE